MKTLLLLLALACGAYGQTLKWEATINAPPDSTEWAFGACKGDGRGGAVLCINYTDDSFVSLGVSIIWYGPTGKILASGFDSTLKSGKILQAGPACAVVELTLADDTKIVRKYTKRGTSVAGLDTPLTKFDHVFISAESSDPDRLGFFVLTSSQNQHQIVAIHRYSFR